MNKILIVAAFVAGAALSAHEAEETLKKTKKQYASDLSLMRVLAYRQGFRDATQYERVVAEFNNAVDPG